MELFGRFELEAWEDCAVVYWPSERWFLLAVECLLLIYVVFDGLLLSIDAREFTANIWSYANYIIQFRFQVKWTFTIFISIIIASSKRKSFEPKPGCLRNSMLGRLENPTFTMSPPFRVPKNPHGLLPPAPGGGASERFEENLSNGACLGATSAVPWRFRGNGRGKKGGAFSHSGSLASCFFGRNFATVHIR